MCRSRRELSNEYLLAKFGVDAKENEPYIVCSAWLKNQRMVRHRTFQLRGGHRHPLERWVLAAGVVVKSNLSDSPPVRLWGVSANRHEGVRKRHCYEPFAGIQIIVYVHLGVDASAQSKLNSWRLPKLIKIKSARSRLYRRRFLQVNTRWKALAEIYTMHSYALLCTAL